MPYLKGNTSKTTILVGPESHKLMLEFEADGDIHVGQPCKLHSDGGKVSPCASGDAASLMVGVSIHEAESAYGAYVVLATRGYVVIKAQSSGSVTPGPVQYAGFDATTLYNKVADLAVVATPDGAAALPESLHVGWALDAGDTGEIIRVLVKG